MKITQVESQKKSANRRTKRFNIFLDGQFAFGADEDLVVEHRLIPGKILDSKDLEKLLFEAEAGKLMDRLYALLNVRPRSEKEIRDYLKNLSFKRKIKGQDEISELVIDQLVEKLKQKEMINDLEFAKAWVEARRRSKQKGARVLKSELFQKGIAREIIEEIIDDQLQIANEEELAKKALEKKMKSWKNLPDMEFRKKSYEFLLRRGFDYSLVKAVVEKILEKG